MRLWALTTATLGALALIAGSVDAAALSTPSMSGPLAANPTPPTFDAGPLGPIYVDGVLSGIGFWQDNHIPSDQTWRGDLSNAQLFVQKTSGWLRKRTSTSRAWCSGE